jgi:hypothetical protein
MARDIKVTIGILLTLFGGLLLVNNFLAAALGWPLVLTWRLWPLAVAVPGLALVLPPLLAPGRRELGALFVPGLPILTVAGLGAATLVLPPAFVWGRFWPQLVLALALGLGLLAVYLRRIWIGLPALVLAGLGAALQFSALTGFWAAWAVLWAVAPLAVGLSLLGIGLVRRSDGLRLAGAALTLSTLIVAVGLAALLTGYWAAASSTVALALIVVGVGLALWGRPGPAQPAYEAGQQL